MRKHFLLLATLLAVATISVAQNHPYVDLGLPSGTLWATCNIGASSPEDYGDYYAWGETETKSTYSWSNYKHGDGSFLDISKKYNNNDNKEVLDKSDDVAYQKWGSDWCMPTEAQVEELFVNCSTKWTKKNGKYGCLFTSKHNGNTLFFPAAGRLDESYLDEAGSDGYYWSSSLETDHPDNELSLHFSSDDDGLSREFRYFGCPVRPVRCNN